ncbi:MAG TPA: plastocyanin/azurin family copper-binding protein [Vicinamibacterales bacterium]|nr:plastocyanin/azurin family copper-binding protein [Vicinamibacterales bacterium]
MRALLASAVSAMVCLGGEPRTLTLTGTEQMKFDRHEIAAKPGVPPHVVLKSVGRLPKAVMAHAFVLVKPGTDLDRFNAAAYNARETGFIPPEMADDVIAHTGLAGAGETVEVTFTAPDKPGHYIFFCSFTMRTACAGC